MISLKWWDWDAAISFNAEANYGAFQLCFSLMLQVVSLVSSKQSFALIRVLNTSHMGQVRAAGSSYKKRVYKSSVLASATWTKLRFWKSIDLGFTLKDRGCSYVAMCWEVIARVFLGNFWISNRWHFRIKTTLLSKYFSVISTADLV